MEIARSLTTNPAFILLDEPFTGVDPKNIREIQLLIADLRARRGLGVLLTDHSVRETLSIADRVYLMFDGQVLFEGTPAAFAADETVRTHYLGSDFQLLSAGKAPVYPVALLLVLMVLAGFIAYAGDVLGTTVGRRRLSLFGWRPKRTGRVVGIAAGVLVMLSTMGVLSLAFRGRDDGAAPVTASSPRVGGAARRAGGVGAAGRHDRAAAKAVADDDSRSRKSS